LLLKGKFLKICCNSLDLIQVGREKLEPLSSRWPQLPSSIGNGAINKTRICSTFNAIYLTVLAVNVLWDSSFWIDYQLPQAYPQQLDHLYTMLAAYSIYDMACMTTTGEHWSMWVHHVLSLWGAVAIMVGFLLGATNVIVL
jgi:hypothetical protein